MPADLPLPELARVAALLAGVYGVGAISGHFYLRAGWPKFFTAIGVFVHESAHAAAAFLTISPVRGFRFSARGGQTLVGRSRLAFLPFSDKLFFAPIVGLAPLVVGTAAASALVRATVRAAGIDPAGIFAAGRAGDFAPLGDAAARLAAEPIFWLGVPLGVAIAFSFAPSRADWQNIRVAAALFVAAHFLPGAGPALRAFDGAAADFLAGALAVAVGALLVNFLGAVFSSGQGRF